MASRIVLSVLLLPLLAAPAVGDEGEAAAWFASSGYAVPSEARIVACHGYGCTRRTEVAVDGPWVARVAGLMRAGRASPAAERRALGEAIRVYTAALAGEFGGAPDQPGSPPTHSGEHGQMDCVDVAANTTSLMLVLKARGLLLHHRVERPESRGLFFDGRYPHTTAVIAETVGGTSWAVDPWNEAPGGRPEIIPLAAWHEQG